MTNITRDNISDFINNEFGLAKKDCDDIVNELIEQIIEGLIKHKIFKIHNFGTFKMNNKKSRLGRNPKTKEEYKISSRNVISFKASKILLRYINGNIDE